jgi:large subunit ribosomal protein L25
VSPARPTLVAAPRDIVGKKVAHLRREGRLPGVVYGHGFASNPLTVDAHEFELLRRHSGPNTLFDLKIGDEKALPALVHGVQFHPVTHRVLHVDLLAVRMTEEMTVEVPVITVGIAPAVERDGGTLNHQLATVRVRALPDHLPQSIEISVAGLETFDDVIRVKDLTVPADAHLLTDPEEVVVRVLAPRVVEAEATTEAEAPAAAAGETAEGAAEAS